MQRGRPKARFGAQAVVVGAEDVLGQHLVQLDLAIEPLCSSQEQFGYRGMHYQGTVDAIGLTIIGDIYSCGPTLWGGSAQVGGERTLLQRS
jgi:hypothetical protein